MTVHVLNYAPRLPKVLTARAGGGSRGVAVPGGAVRWLLLAVSLAVGVGVAAVTMHMSSYWGFSL
jgi:hypothetical protein